MRLLVVEDEPRLLRSLAKALREEGYAVDIADTGDEGLYKLVNFNYDAIVLDVMLPQRDGWQLLERLRKHKQTPVFMLTALDATENRVHGLDTGADDYLVKPFDLAECTHSCVELISPLARNTASRSTANSPPGKSGEMPTASVRSSSTC